MNLLPNSANLFDILRITFFNKQNRFYYIGLPKTGSTSLANLLSSRKAVHEFMEQETLMKYLDYRQGIINTIDFKNFLLEREKRMNSNFDITTCNFHYVDFLKQNENNKFIVSFRDVRSWINSYLNFKNYYAQNITDEVALQKNDVISFFMKKTVTNGFFTDSKNIQAHFDEIIDPLINYWSNGMETVLADLPKNTLVLNFYKREENLKLISDFTNIPIRKFQFEKWNDNVSVFKHDYFSEQPEKYQTIIEQATNKINILLMKYDIKDIRNFEPFIHE